uniref:Uncharacterized protein n=1 Tax=viral metagenome TaxID=1070528 RepID=A0A6H1ZEL7_9ZZZZ
MTKKGKLTISRGTTNTDESECINLELTDGEFRMLFLAEVTLTDFARALTGLGDVPCDYKVWDQAEV